MEDIIPLETQTNELLSILESKKTDLKKLISIKDVAGEIYMGFGSGLGQGGAHFSAQLINRIATLGLDINLDLYPPDINDKFEGRL